MNLEDLLYSAFLSGSKDACNIIAEHFAGDTETFTERMNSRALSLGCDQTHFTNPSGLIDSEQYTTAWDQYLIFKAAVEHPLFVKIAGTVTYRTNPTLYARGRTIINTNQLLREDSPYYDQRCIAGCVDPGGENGQSFVTCADNGELTVITVLLGSDNSGEEETDQAPELSQIMRLLDWGFDGFAWQIVLDEGEIITREHVEMADGTGNVELCPERSVSVLVRTDLTSEDIIKSVDIYATEKGETLTAPISEGTALGKVTVYIDGTVRGTVELVAARDVGLNEKMFIKTRLEETLSKKWVQLGIGLLLTVMIGYTVLVIRDVRLRRRRKQAREETRRKLIEDRRNKSNTFR